MLITQPFSSHAWEQIWLSFWTRDSVQQSVLGQYRRFAISERREKFLPMDIAVLVPPFGFFGFGGK